MLLVRRGREPARGRWAFPGGSVERGETMAEATRREVRDETGLVVADVAFLEHHEVIDGRGDEISHHFVIAVHRARCAAEAIPIAGDDAAEAKFLLLDDLDSFDVTETTLATIRRHARSQPGAGQHTGLC